MEVNFCKKSLLHANVISHFSRDLLQESSSVTIFFLYFKSPALWYSIIVAWAKYLLSDHFGKYKFLWWDYHWLYFSFSECVLCNVHFVGDLITVMWNTCMFLSLRHVLTFAISNQNVWWWQKLLADIKKKVWDKRVRAKCVLPQFLALEVCHTFTPAME